MDFDYSVSTFSKFFSRKSWKKSWTFLGLPHACKVKLAFTGGVDGGRGWKGYVKNMMLSISKLVETGWKPNFDSEKALRFATRSCFKDMF